MNDGREIGLPRRHIIALQMQIKKCCQNYSRLCLFFNRKKNGVINSYALFIFMYFHRLIRNSWSNFNSRKHSRNCPIDNSIKLKKYIILAIKIYRFLLIIFSFQKFPIGKFIPAK